MKAIFNLFLNLCFGLTLFSQTTKLIIPVEGVINKDYFFVNHVDLDTAKNKIKDYNCGFHTYDSHQGNDIALKSFKAMDSGVYIIAAAKGKITTVIQSNYDRNKTSVISRGFGNYIAINHGNGIFTYYAHIRKNSSLVKINDSVQQGQRLALIGSSGNSTDPHLHFEMWDNFTPRLIDPFKGSCQKLNSMWRSQPKYDTTYQVIADGLIPFQATYDTIREYLPTPKVIDTSGKFLTYWIHSIESRANDTSLFQWYTPQGNLWYSYQYIQPENARYAHFWNYIYTPKDTGWWVVNYLKNGTIRSSRKFRVGDFVTSLKENLDQSVYSSSQLSIYNFGSGNFKVQLMNNQSIDEVKIYSLEGKLLASSLNNEFHIQLPLPILIFEVKSGKEIYKRKYICRIRG